jgi:predicted nucleic acid-binding protein
MDGSKVYIDSSVVLRKLLDAPRAVPDWGSWTLAVASELVQVEALRTLDRLRILGELSATQCADCVEELGLWLSAFELAPVDRSVLRRAAGPFSTAIGTLDAIHLATALLWMEREPAELTFVTHDRQQAAAARACGIEVQFTP